MTISPEKKLGILLIENDPIDTEWVRRALAEEGKGLFELECVERLSEGLARLRKEGIGLVILDLSLSDCFGLEVFEKIHSASPHLPVVILTGSVQEEKIALEILNKGAQDYLFKGKIDPATLIRSLRYAIERNRLKQELEKLDQLKSDFVSTVSHEIRTPLAVIQEGISGVMDGLCGEITDQQKHYLTLSLRNVDRLRVIIDDLLDISKIEAGKTALRKTLVDLGALVNEVKAGFREQAKEKRLELRFKLPASEIQAFIDKGRISQVFTNLIGNALKFTEKGFIEISLADRGETIEASVTDTGRGISKEDQSHLFEKFRQFGRVAGSGEKGTGLGLSICKGLIEAHQGKIWLESKAGEGSKFMFTLPKVSVQEVFKEYVSQGVEGALRTKSHMSIIVVRIRNFDEIQKEMGKEGARSLVRELEGSIRQSLRRRGDVVLKDTWEFLMILPDTEKPDAFVVEGRIRKALDEDLSRRPLKPSVDLRSAVATFPGDGQTAEALVEFCEKRLLRKKKILIVDDDRDFVKLLSDRLNSTNEFDCAPVLDGHDALMKVSEETPDAIICDLRLVGLSGEEVVKRLKGDEKTREIPVVILTAYKVEEARASLLGTIPVLEKSERLDELVQTLKRYI